VYNRSYILTYLYKLSVSLDDAVTTHVKEWMDGWLGFNCILGTQVAAISFMAEEV